MTHTSATGGVSGACPDLDTLADLHAGVLDEGTASTLRAHVESCADCQATLAALDATVLSLASMPPVEIPADVAARIDAAIAGEAGRVDGGQRQSQFATPPTAPSSDRRLGSVPSMADSAPSSNVRSLAEHREKRGLGRPRMLLVAAAAAAIVAGGAVVLTQTVGGNSNANTASEQTTTAQAPGGDAERPGDVQTFASPSEVLEQGAIENDKVSESVAGRMAEKSARNQCLNEIVPRPASAPEAVQQGTYDGKDAFAFVFGGKSADEITMIIVAADDCGTTLATESGTR